MTQYGAQAASEGQSLLFIDRDLRNAANLIFDRIFDGDDLVFVGLDFVDSSVERGRLTATGWPCHQHHAVRLFDVTAEASQVVFVKTHNIKYERMKLLAHRFFVEHTEYSVFAVDRRHNRDTEVDWALGAAIFHAAASVLRYAALGNVELAHDLDSGNDG